jgi:hypothetical protein
MSAEVRASAVPLDHLDAGFDASPIDLIARERSGDPEVAGACGRLTLAIQAIAGVVLGLDDLGAGFVDGQGLGARRARLLDSGARRRLVLYSG